MSLLLHGLDQCHQRLRGQLGVIVPPPLVEEWCVFLAQCIEAEMVIQIVSAIALTDVTGEAAQFP